MKKSFFAGMMLLAAVMACPTSAKTTYHNITADTDTTKIPTVYFVRQITPENLIKVAKATGREVKGDNVAIKLSTGEAGNPNHLSPDLIKEFVQGVNGTIVECNTAYGGKRSSTAEHLQTAKEHGFTAIAPVDIMDADGEVALPVKKGKWLKEDLVGKNLMAYDFLVDMSHFKGHPMAGFGGALKNMSIGIASRDGKGHIHSAGKVADANSAWSNLPRDNNYFQEAMAEACEAVIDHFTPEKILYINVANNLSVDCDCVSRPARAEILDIGIFASTDPIAIDRACVDAVNEAPDHGKIHLQNRIKQQKGMRILEYGEELGLGSQAYKLVEL